MTCPICKKPVSAEDQEQSKLLPFCSNRCRQIDFFRWSEGSYAIEESLDERPDLLADPAENDEEYDG